MTEEKKEEHTTQKVEAEDNVSIDKKSNERDKKFSSRNLRYKKRFCRFCKQPDLIENIDYKNYKFLFEFLTNRGKITSRRFTGTCSKHQRILSKEIKRSRLIGLLPFKIQ